MTIYFDEFAVFGCLYYPFYYACDNFDSTNLYLVNYFHDAYFYNQEKTNYRK